MVADRWLIERYAARAWPATEVREDGGWLLRHTPGVPRRRSNSALPLAPGEGLLAALPRVEEFYAGRAMPVVVQVAPAQEHAELDGSLAERGYRRAAPTLVCTAPVGTVVERSRPTGPMPVTIADHAADSWLAGYVELAGDENARRTADNVLARIPGPAACLSVERDGRVIGRGLVVGAPGWAGIFCMKTHPAHQRQGVASAILHAGARWAEADGAAHLYLQVMDDAEHRAARGLYERVGFRRSHTYHYRVKP